MSPGILLALKVLDVALAAAELAPGVRAEFERTRTKLQTFADEGRDPTNQEWDELFNDVHKQEQLLLDL